MCSKNEAENEVSKVASGQVAALVGHLLALQSRVLREGRTCSLARKYSPTLLFFSFQTSFPKKPKKYQKPSFSRFLKAFQRLNLPSEVDAHRVAYFFDQAAKWRFSQQQVSRSL